MKEIDQRRNSPWQSLILLLVVTLVSTFAVQLLVLLFAILLSGQVSFVLDTNLGIDFKKNPVFSYSMIVASSFGTFLLPAWILQMRERYNDYFPRSRRDGLLISVLTVVFMFSFVPTMQLFAEWNGQMVLPEAFKEIEEWMREKEEGMAMLTAQMVMVDQWHMLALNIFALAIMPAIAEEFYFRGALMTIFQRMLKNHHLSIWLTAIIFSAIHVQFFGFIPRMLLGAFFGYMLLWTNNIWIPTLAHFINNASATVLAFYYARQGKTYEDLQSFEVFPIFVYIGSFMLSGILCWYFYRRTHQIEGHIKQIN